MKVQFTFQEMLHALRMFDIVVDVALETKIVHLPRVELVTKQNPKY